VIQHWTFPAYEIRGLILSYWSEVGKGLIGQVTNLGCAVLAVFFFVDAEEVRSKQRAAKAWILVSIDLLVFLSNSSIVRSVKPNNDQHVSGCQF
jgi:hypothetical protein